MAAVHDAGFMGQPGEGSQEGYCVMLTSEDLYEGQAITHLLDWGSSKIHRKVRSTLGAEACGATKAYDRAMYARAMLYEIEHGHNNNWTEMCKQVPFCLGTDCKSLYDLCTKDGSLPQERRVALDLLDVREGIEHFGDRIRWIPTDHMLVDCMTKAMAPHLMLEYLKTGRYALKYDEVIKNTKREKIKARNASEPAQPSSAHSASSSSTASGTRAPGSSPAS